MIQTTMYLYLSNSLHFCLENTKKSLNTIRRDKPILFLTFDSRNVSKWKWPTFFFFFYISLRERRQLATSRLLIQNCRSRQSEKCMGKLQNPSLSWKTNEGKHPPLSLYLPRAQAHTRNISAAKKNDHTPRREIEKPSSANLRKIFSALQQCAATEYK